MQTTYEFKLPKWDDIPNIDLYLDQVISLIDAYLSPILRENKEDAILTKTMVNNYVKHRIIEPPTKKKYNKNSICCLISICILKSVYSMSEISILIKTALAQDSFELTYKRFCESIEKAVTCAFEGNSFSEKGIDPNFPYIMQNIANSFATRLYAIKYCESKENTQEESSL